MQLPNNLSNAISRVEGQLDDKDWSPHLLQALTTLDAGRWRLSTLVHFAPTSVVHTAPTWVVCFAATAVLKHHLIPGTANTFLYRFRSTRCVSLCMNVENAFCCVRNKSKCHKKSAPDPRCLGVGAKKSRRMRSHHGGSCDAVAAATASKSRNSSMRHFAATAVSCHAATAVSSQALISLPRLRSHI